MNNKDQASRPTAWAATNEDGDVEALGVNESRRFDTPLYTAGQLGGGAAAIAAVICRAVSELPDRNSPADWPEAMLVTRDELTTIVADALATPMQDARQQLTEAQIGAAVRAAHIAFCLDKFQTFERALVHFTEQAHGIAAQKVGA